MVSARGAVRLEKPLPPRSGATSGSSVPLLCGSPVGCPKLQVVNEDVSVDDLVLNNPAILHG